MNITALTAIPRVFGTQLERLFSGVSHVKTGLTVAAVGVGSTFVAVAAGTGVTASGTAFSFIGGTLDMGPADSNPRYDLVVVASGASSPTKVAGTPSNAPVPPALPAGALLLAITYLPAGATDFSTGGFINDYTMVWGLGNGTAAVPSLPFTSDPTTGIYRIAASRMGITIAGAHVAEFGATYMAIGATPAAGGAIRLPNDAAGAIMARNAANTQSIAWGYLGSSNQLLIGSGGDVAPANISINAVGLVSVVGSSFAIGTTPATAGTIRLPNLGRVAARNAANSADITLLDLDGSNIFTVGATAAAALTFTGPSAGDVNMNLGSNRDMIFRNNGTEFARLAGAGPSFAVGANPATAGTIRLPNSGATYARNNANTLNIRESMVFTDDALYIGNGASLIYTEAKLQTVASASGAAGIVLPHGSAPSSPINGDIWTTTSGLFARINGATVAYAASNPLTDVQTFTSVGAATWTKPTTGTPKSVRVLAWAAGGGGGGAQGGAAGTDRWGGGGGGGGAFVDKTFDPSVLGATEAVTIGTGGTAGTGGNSANGTDGGGGAGTNTSFGAHLTVYGGGGGRAGISTGGGSSGGGGGGLQGGGGAGSGTGGDAGAPWNNSFQASIGNFDNVWPGGGGQGCSVSSANGGGWGSGGGGGGSCRVSTPAASTPGGSTLGGGGGGGGGGGVTAGGSETTGGSGGLWNAPMKIGGGANGGGGAAGAANGGAGGAGTARSLTGKSGDGGGGGGGQDSGTGGVGGAGGAPGGGGGGGASGANLGGNGGVGARGEMIVITYF